MADSPAADPLVGETVGGNVGIAVATGAAVGAIDGAAWVPSTKRKYATKTSDSARKASWGKSK